MLFESFGTVRHVTTAFRPSPHTVHNSHHPMGPDPCLPRSIGGGRHICTAPPQNLLRLIEPSLPPSQHYINSLNVGGKVVYMKEVSRSDLPKANLPHVEACHGV